MLETSPGPSGAERGEAAGRRAPSAAVLRTKVRLQDLQLRGEPVLVRTDFNVPVDDGRVADATRIEASLPTLRHLLRAGALPVVMSHRGRPGGKRDAELTMAPVAQQLAARLGAEVRTADDCIGAAAKAAVAALRTGEVLLLENLRFHPGEISNDPRFAQELAGLADIYVDDAFGASHRQHASIVGVAGVVRVAAAGDLLQREVKTLSRVLIQPHAPFVLVLGGAKVQDKVGIIGNLLPLVDQIVIGGAMANAFLAAQGRAIGISLAPADAITQAKALLRAAVDAGVDVVVPDDLVAAPGRGAGSAAHVVTEVANDEMALDIGPSSRARFAAVLSSANTVVWNGPMGVFEEPAFAAGTMAVAKAIAGIGAQAFTVVGGGDTAAAAAAAGILGAVSHVSTGGGAVLDLLSGAILPGVAALTDRVV